MSLSRGERHGGTLALQSDRFVAVGSVAGVMFHAEGLAIVGEAMESHRLIGARDPLYSANPLAHGAVHMPSLGAARTQRRYTHEY